MTWALIVVNVVAVLVLLVLAMWAIGRRLPTDHTTVATLRLNQKPQDVWDVLSNTEALPTWSGINKVERLPDQNGKERWRQWMGRNSFVLETTRNEPPRLLETTIADDAKFFSGSWEFLIEPAGDGCTVRLTEHGRIAQAIPRFMMKYIVDPGMYLKRHLRALAAKFGEEPRLS
ncbi:MAG: SRPBCC family protein [Phycisphaeraceae bacterium]|nr:SRPBCC family protein [Phycisphaeraceae bacterium]